MTDIFQRLVTTVENAQFAIYQYNPAPEDTINNGTDLYNVSRQQGGENAIESLRAAAYNAMMNPSAKAAFQRGDLDVEAYFNMQYKGTVDMALHIVADTLGLNEDDYVGGGAFEQAGAMMDAAAEQLSAAKEFRKQFRANQPGYPEAVARLEEAKRAVRSVELAYPSFRDIELTIMMYIFHYLAGYGDGTNWKIKVAIVDGIIDGIQSRSINTRDVYNVGAAKNFHPAMIAEVAFGNIVEGPRSYVDEDSEVVDLQPGETSYIGDPNDVEFRYNQIIQWMSSARRPNGRNDDIYIARQKIPDDVWDGYKEQVIQRYQKAVKLINDQVNVWDEASYQAAKAKAAEEARKDEEFLDTEEDIKLEDLNDKQIDEYEKFYNQVDDDEDLEDISEEQTMRDLAAYAKQIEKAKQDELTRGQFRAFRDDIEEASEDEDDDMGDLTEEQIQMYKQALEGTPDQ